VQAQLAQKAPAQRRRLSRATRGQIAGILFISPWLIGFLAFTAFPILASLYYSFTLYDIINAPRFIGLNNFTFMFTTDPSFPIVIYNTVYFVVLGVPAATIVSFLLAALLNRNIVGRPVFRTIFFLPFIVPSVATAMVWLWMYNPNYGLLDGTLSGLGMQVIPWLGSPSLAKISLLIISVWGQGATIVIFLAALQDVPRELYDAAKVDGANGFRRFLSVTIPLCTPSILFVVITGLIGWFQYFTIAWIITQGGPMQSTESYSIYLYQSAFQFLKMGYAAALAWVLFLVIMLFTIITFRSSARWVYYAGN
jgi:multiple sugar transport system permease protein